MTAPEDRFDAAKARVEGETHKFIVDTPELAEEHRVPIGTTILMRKPQQFSANMQDIVDDLTYKLFCRNRMTQ